MIRPREVSLQEVLPKLGELECRSEVGGYLCCSGDVLQERRLLLTSAHDSCCFGGASCFDGGVACLLVESAQRQCDARAARWEALAARSNDGRN